MKWGMVMEPWYVANHEEGMDELSYKGYWEFVMRERERGFRSNSGVMYIKEGL